MGRHDEPKLRSNDLVLLGLILAVTVAVAFGIRTQTRSKASVPESVAVEQTATPTDGDRSIAPSIAGRVLPVVDETAQAPVPVQWNGSGAGIPFAQWWSSATVGPGSETLWSLPLATRIDPSGRVEIAAPTSTVAADGTTFSPFIPTVTLLGSSGDALIEVTDSGAFHAVIDIAANDSGRQLGLVQGSPFVEVALDATSEWFIPGLNVTSSTDDVVEFETAEGPWIIASSGAMGYLVDGDMLTIDADGPRQLVVGPRLGDVDRWSEIALETANAPLQTTTEETILGPDGSVTQELSVVRDGGASSAFVLLPHQVEVAGETPNGELVLTTERAVTVTVAKRLELNYPSVPIAWDLLDPAACDGCDSVAPDANGSYFAGKEALRLGQLAQLALDLGDQESAQPYLNALEILLDDLVSRGGRLEMTWDPNWGSVVVFPSEFGLGEQLNDHILQYGHWIAAASIFEQHRSGSVPGLVEAIDLLVGDMGGSSLIEGVWPGLAEQRAWSPYEGHSWASGLAPFDDGNNLESVSESLNGWWATARWLTVTGRSDQAGEAIARFTIESALSSDLWLPTESLEGARPWSGIVWAGKIDNGTWFDGRPEAALGIRLLPLSPASLARYGTQADVEAAKQRWSWCDQNGGCMAMWSNLLDSDAVVAGRPELQPGPEPERSTSVSVSAWWRTLIETRGTPSFRWSCSAGIVAFDVDSQQSVALGTSPSGIDTTGVCRNNTTGVIASIGLVADGQTEFDLPRS